MSLKIFSYNILDSVDMNIEGRLERVHINLQILYMNSLDYLELVQISIDIKEHIIDACEKRQIGRPIEIISVVDPDHELMNELVDDAVIYG